MISAPPYLVVGSGSIAKRHISNLRHLFPASQVGCVSSSGRALSVDETGADIIFDTLDSALAKRPAFAIVASPAVFHLSHAAPLIEAGVPVLIEKPLSNSLSEYHKVSALLTAHRDKIAVGYNLRLLESAIWLRRLVETEAVGHIHSVRVEVGQYLPDWRPNTEYRVGVSARADFGGGALLELSHELDYLTWIFGRFETAYCVAESSKTLALDVEDNVTGVLWRRGGPSVSLQMDFLQRAPVRKCTVVGEKATLVWDLLKNSITSSDSTETKVVFADPHYDRNGTYLKELVLFSELASGGGHPAVGVEEAAYVLSLIEALRNSARSGQATRLTQQEIV